MNQVTTHKHVEVEPNPTWDVLRDLVAHMKYRPDWHVGLTEIHRQDGGHGLRFDMYSVGYDTYHPDRGQTYRVRHSFIVPPASYNEQSWAMTDDNLLMINGENPASFIKKAYGFGVDLSGPGRYDVNDPVQTELRRIRDWITMAEHDALEAR